MSENTEKTDDLISGAISKLTENPELLGNILSAIKSSGIDVPADKAPPPVKEPEPIPAVTPPLASLPPELISKLPLILSLVGGKGAPQSKAERDREALLCALKPYLSPERCAAIDKVIQLSRIGDLLGKT